MTTRRLVSHSLVLALVTALAGCGKDNPAGPSSSSSSSGSGNANCSYTVGNEPVIAVTASGGELAVAVTAAAGCGWTASSNSSFITVMGSATGSGNGTARFSIQANTGTGRLGSIRVADRPIDIVQASGIPQVCNFAVSPTDVTTGSSGGDVSIAVTNDTSCVWSATSNDGFITVKSGATGTGNGTVVLTIAAGTTARTGTATIAGKTVTINQQAPAPAPPPPPPPGCAFTVSPLQSSPSASGATINITVTQTQGTSCAWAAQSQSGFLTVTSGSSGTGSGTVTISVAVNSGTARTGTVAVAGQTVTINQQAASSAQCSFNVSPTQIPASDAGGNFVLTITQTQGGTCNWTAQANDAFLTFPNGASGTGSGSTTLSVAANTGNARTGFATVAGTLVAVSQTASGSSGTQAAILSFQSDSGDYIGAGQSASYTVTGLQFTASYNAGSGELQFNIPPSFGNWWSLSLAAAPGQQLTPGLYTRAARSAFRGSQPGLDFNGSGRGCNQVTGRFLVAEAVYVGNTIQRFHARFEQHCEGVSTPLRGQIWIDAAGSTSPPPLAQFPSSPTPPSTFLTFQSDAGDYIGGGTSQSFSLATTQFSGWSQSTSAVQISLRGLAPAAPGWSLALSAPSGQPLVPGTYANAMRYPFQSPGSSGLSFSGNGRGCNTSTGSFVVLEVVYGPQGELERFHATFEQHCEGAVAALRGEIYIVADPWR
ncbi:MAG TPA: BACON domain-containing carbohydrate-binding protein [Vicinamibacterales bacterium]|nr:BACON domain-containing carbohydrate-binding protein [Vicinamibacterales bacterium]